MQAIETMMEEHRLILRVLDALSAYTDALADGDPLEAAELARFVEFIRDFADKAHHAKEEDILFAGMIEQGFPSEGGPIGVMLAEHDEGRGYVSVMADAALSTAPFSRADTNRVIHAARCFIEMLRMHIMKEDQILYPMADMQLSEQVKDDIDQRTAAFEDAQHRAGRTAALHKLAAGLIDRHTGDEAAAGRRA